MANICITSFCNTACDFCFSRNAITGRGTMSLDMFLQIIENLSRSGAGDVRFLGGEPTLHPAFVEMVAAALKNKLRAIVFTNGIISFEKLDALYDLRCHNLLMVLNIAAMAGTVNGRVVGEQFLKKLAAHIMPGITIASRGQNLDPVLDFIDTYNLIRTVRLSLAHPAPGEGNRYLHPKFYREVAPLIMRFLENAHSRRIHIEFDCGFVPCMFDGIFDDKEYILPANLGCRCNPLPDFLPDGTAIACFPLAQTGTIPFNVSKKVSDYQNEFSRLLAPYKDVGVFSLCSSCHWKNAGSCLGGCKATALRRLCRSHMDSSRSSNNPAGIRGVEVHTIEAVDLKPIAATSGKVFRKPQWVIPYIDQPISFWNCIAGEFGPWIKEVYFPLPNELNIGSGRPSQPQEHLREFLRCSTLPRSVIVNPIVLPGPAENAFAGIIDRLKKLSDSIGVTGVTVSNIHLAEAIRKKLPGMRLTASVLLDIYTPLQIQMIEGLFDVIVAASRIMRDRKALKRLKMSSECALRLIVNETCLPGCPFRTQHFYEMCSGTLEPRSLCDQLLERKPWLRLTGAWVLPQHLNLFDGLYDELKLAGRVTLRNPDAYSKVLGAYIHRLSLLPHEIGGGPASVLESREIDARFYKTTLTCNKDCDKCDICKNYINFPTSNFLGTVTKEDR